MNFGYILSVIADLLTLRRVIVAFRTPNFNLDVNLWRDSVGGPQPYATPLLQFKANLSLGRRSFFTVVTTGVSLFLRELLCPAGTDIRGPGINTTLPALANDTVEVPAGSKRFYTVEDVDDVGKGFGNEYRLATLKYDSGGHDFSDIGHVPPILPLP